MFGMLDYEDPRLEGLGQDLVKYGGDVWRVTDTEVSKFVCEDGSHGGDEIPAYVELQSWGGCTFLCEDCFNKAQKGSK